MKYILIAVAALIAIPLVMYIIGLFLPESHSSTVNRVIAGERGQVWAAITDVNKKSAWDPAVERVEILSDSLSALKWREYYVNNDPMTFEEVSRSDSSLWVVRIADEQLPFGGTWSYALEPASPGTKVTITEDGEIYNPIFRFVSRFILGYEATMNNSLNNLEAYFQG